jgi:hypothetical protein
MRAYVLVLMLAPVAPVAACSDNEPQYLVSPTPIEAGLDNGSGGFTTGSGSLTFPIKKETAAEMTARMALAAKLGVKVPYVKVGDIDIEVDYSIQNLDNTAAQAEIGLDGANEWWIYNPAVLMLFPPGTDDAPMTPDLQGDIPINVPAMGTVTGTFTEDDLLEAAVDCDMITRGNISPFHAVNTINKNAPNFQPLSAYIVPATSTSPAATQNDMGPVVPREAFANLIRVTLVFQPQAHMVLNYTVRLRDQRGIVDPYGLQSPDSQTTDFMPVLFTVAMASATGGT